jgi:hypothetical protein
MRYDLDSGMSEASAMRAFRFAILSGAMCVAAAACGGGGGGGSPYGGSITALNVTGLGGASANAAFFSDIQGGTLNAGDLNAAIPSGGCVFDQPAAALPTNLTFTYVDAGPTLSLGGPAPVNMTEAVAGSAFTYSFSGSPTSIPAGTYDVTFAGNGSSVPAETWSGAFKMPASPQITAPTGFPGQVQFPGASDLHFTWNPSGGHAVVILFIGSDFKTLACRAADSGSFTVKPADLAKITPTGAIFFESYTFGTHSFLGRTVTLSGTTGIFGAYQKT